MKIRVTQEVTLCYKYYLITEVIKSCRNTPFILPLFFHLKMHNFWLNQGTLKVA